jgi:3-oxoacyl-[acyl-carrier protein] reductase
MAGLVPAIHVFDNERRKTWMPGTRPGMTVRTGQTMKASELFDLTGRVALVTGASSGLGTQFARALADNGAAVALVARRVDRLTALRDEIEAKGGRAVAIEADVTDRAAMLRAFDAAEASLGTVTILVNNAGVAQAPVRATDVAPEEWRRVLSTDLDAVFYWAQEGARRMLAANKKGAIVNIASVLGFGVAKGVAAYAVAKAAVVQATKALALELAFKGVRVNAIAPGWFVTEINDTFLNSEAGNAMKRDIPMGRFGNAGDLDGALLLLVSDAGAYMTGATILVDGGQVVALKG